MHVKRCFCWIWVRIQPWHKCKQANQILFCHWSFTGSWVAVGQQRGCCAKSVQGLGSGKKSSELITMVSKSRLLPPVTFVSILNLFFDMKNSTTAPKIILVSISLPLHQGISISLCFIAGIQVVRKICLKKQPFFLPGGECPGSRESRAGSGLGDRARRLVQVHRLQTSGFSQTSGWSQRFFVCRK